MAKPRSRVETTLDGKILQNYMTTDHAATDRKDLWSFFAIYHTAYALLRGKLILLNA